jgi:hypothetical protein
MEKQITLTFEATDAVFLTCMVMAMMDKSVGVLPHNPLTYSKIQRISAEFLKQIESQVSDAEYRQILKAKEDE